MLRIRGTIDAGGRLPALVPADGSGGDGLPAGGAAAVQIHPAGPPGTAVSGERSPRCRRPRRFPRLQLVDCTGGEEAGDSSVLLSASTALGVGSVARAAHEEIRRSCDQLPAVRGRMVSAAFGCGRI